ncbi:MAG: phosphoesterase [Gammaproteobacteria bacterium]|nr:phosphoesterase [Gammaproteobacteria bacterium]
MNMLSDATMSEQMQAALKLPNGARFYCCALQVNPFAYLARHGKQTPYQSEEEYNNAITDACVEEGIEVIAVTDHYRVKESKSLTRLARDKGIYVFSGFEAVAKDGVHFICLFDLDVLDEDDEKKLERSIGKLIQQKDQDSPIGDLDSVELLEEVRKWGAICIAAHATSQTGGLLKTLSGQTRIQVWKSENLLACSLRGRIEDEQNEGFKQILANKNSQHKRLHAPAVINATDVSSPENIKKEKASCLIKMSSISVEALRQAFLDPGSRIRLHSDEQPEPHAELLAITWEGGFLRDTSIHFNSNLNVLVGGRGTGKSTVIESIRYALALDPLGEEARKAHEGVVQRVLQAGTKVSLLAQSHKPSPQRYVIERSVPNPPVVKDEKGEVLSLSPSEIISGIEIFGQHEISELAGNKGQLTQLLKRFIDYEPVLLERKAKLQIELEKSRSRIVTLQREIAAFEERLVALPNLEETQRRFKQAGLEERLKEKSALVREQRLFLDIEECIEPVQAIYSELSEEVPIDTAFTSTKALKGLPNANLLENVGKALKALNTRLGKVKDDYGQALEEVDLAIENIKSQWKIESKAIEETYEKLLRELQESKVDGAEFIQLREQIERLRPLKDKTEKLRQDLNAYKRRRLGLLAEWSDLQANDFRKIDDAAKLVSKKLKDRVRVKVQMAGNREPLYDLLRELGGNLSAAIERLQNTTHLSLPEFAERCQEGKEALMEHYGFPPRSAERIASGDPDLFMRIEELDLPVTTQIELNAAAEGSDPIWQKLDDLSTGQKATAVLLLLLLDSETPLIIDQPEDDLDNRFITEGILPTMRNAKRQRQFVFSTHNANIPVLGDAELILGLDASGGAAEGKARIDSEHMSSIDSRPIQELVEDILEGGKAAFEMRRSKYGF